MTPPTIPRGPFILRGVGLPAAHCGPDIVGGGGGEIVAADLGIANGCIARPKADWPAVDASGWLALPPFVDAHAHLDKAFTLARTGPGDGTLGGAIALSATDTPRRTPEDLARRMRRGALAALGHGTGAMRTHLDTLALPDETPAWDVLDDLRAELAGRIELQAVALGAVDRALAPDFAERCAQVARRGGVLGAFIPPGPPPREAIRTLLDAAGRHGLDVDFHTDENLGTGAPAIGEIAEAVIETGHEGRVVAGHCCALSRLEGDALARLADRIALAGIHIIALPLTNAWLQDRRKDASPRLRGVAPLRELIAAGIPVSAASDNVRDAFCPFGDFDMIEVLRAAIMGAHLGGDMAGAMALGLGAPADAMGITPPRIAIGGAADLTLFRARNWPDLLAGANADRVVLRGGRDIGEVS